MRLPHPDFLSYISPKVSGVRKKDVTLTIERPGAGSSPTDITIFKNSF
jgi:hypothetical protein